MRVILDRRGLFSRQKATFNNVERIQIYRNRHKTEILHLRFEQGNDPRFHNDYLQNWETITIESNGGQNGRYE
jgi:hypothetical protein